MATTIDDGLSSGREGLSEGEIKPQKLKKMKNHLGLALKYFNIGSKTHSSHSNYELYFSPAATVLGDVKCTLVNTVLLNIGTHKVGRVFLAAIVSLLPHVEFELNDHRGKRTPLYENVSP